MQPFFHTHSEASVHVPRRQAGFGLMDIIIALGIVGIIVAGLLFFRNVATGEQRTQEVVRAVTLMAADISKTFGRAHTFTHVTSTSVINGRLVAPPFRIDGTVVRDMNGVTTTFAGNATHFGISFTEPDINACGDIASALFNGAQRMHISAGAASTLAIAALVGFAGGTPPTGGAVVKANAASTMDSEAINAACAASGDSRTITVIFR